MTRLLAILACSWALAAAVPGQAQQPGGTLDSAAERRQPQIYRLRHADPSTVAATLSRELDPAGARVAPYEPGHAVVVLAPRSVQQQAATRIAELDAPAAPIVSAPGGWRRSIPAATTAAAANPDSGGVNPAGAGPGGAYSVLRPAPETVPPPPTAPAAPPAQIGSETPSGEPESIAVMRVSPLTRRALQALMTPLPAAAQPAPPIVLSQPMIVLPEPGAAPPAAGQIAAGQAPAVQGLPLDSAQLDALARALAELSATVPQGAQGANQRGPIVIVLPPRTGQQPPQLGARPGANTAR